MLTLEERAHDVAEMVASWELDHIAKRAKEEHKTVNINVHNLYRKYYGELLNIFSQDPKFNPELTPTETEQQ
jgi:hypothetical protein